MGRPGRPPVPTERKRALGNPGKRPLPEPLVVLSGAIEPPEPLRPLLAPGLAFWERLWRSGRAWVSPDIDVELVQMLCEAIDERLIVRQIVLVEGDDKSRRALRELDRQITDSLSLLGFTPTDRARLGLAEVKTQTRIEELRARQAQRAVASKVADSRNSG